MNIDKQISSASEQGLHCKHVLTGLAMIQLINLERHLWQILRR